MIRKKIGIYIPEQWLSDQSSNNSGDIHIPSQIHFFELKKVLVEFYGVIVDFLIKVPFTSLEYHKANLEEKTYHVKSFEIAIVEVDITIDYYDSYNNKRKKFIMSSKTYISAYIKLWSEPNNYKFL